MSDIHQRIRIIGKNGERVPLEPTPSEVSAKTIRSLYPSADKIVTTDFLVTTNTRSALFSPDGRLTSYLCDEGVVSVDHHVPDDPLVQGTSTNMAFVHVEHFGSWQEGSPPILGTHKDADSILASGILSGYLTPQARFGEAAIAADHTGEENPIADLLQALRDRGDETDIAPSFDCLHILLTQGEDALPNYALQLLLARRGERETLRKIVEEGAFEHMGAGVHYAQLPRRVNGELLPVLLPNASVIVVAYPLSERKMTEAQQRKQVVFEVKTRTGAIFPTGRSLHEFNLPNWGGREHAGSTGRLGGTEDPRAFAMLVVKKIKQLQAEKY